jgi:hypothetical protein
MTLNMKKTKEMVVQERTIDQYHLYYTNNFTEVLCNSPALVKKVRRTKSNNTARKSVLE